MILCLSERTFGSSLLLWHVLSESTWSVQSQSLNIDDVSRVSARSLAEAGDDHADEGATAGDTKDNEADHVVDGHESSGRDLVEVANRLGVLSSGNTSFVKRVTGGKLARGAVSPDESGDPPGESTAAGTATDETRAERSETVVNAGGEGDEKGTNHGDHLLDETPGEPGNEVAMDIGQGTFSVVDSGDLLGTSSISTVEAGAVGVGESVLSEEDAESNETTAAGESAEARNCDAAGTSANDLAFESVHL